VTVLPATFKEQLFRSEMAVPAWGFDVVRAVLGCILLTAAVLKGWELATEPVANDSIFSYRWSLTAQVEVELFLALWLLSGLYRRQVWWAALVGFAFFSCVTLYKGLSGAASCGCFGKVEVSPWYTLVLDLAAVAALLLFRPVVQADRQTRAVRMRVAVATLLLLAVGIPGGVAMVGYQPAALANDGQLIGEGEFVLLEPETWVGKPFPLLDYIDIGDQLAEGDWIVLLYHHDCPSCREAIAAYERAACEFDGVGATRVALIEVPPYGPLAHRLGSKTSIRAGRLSDAKEWAISTPTAIILSESNVTNLINEPWSPFIWFATDHASRLQLPESIEEPAIELYEICSMSRAGAWSTIVITVVNKQERRCDI